MKEIKIILFVFIFFYASCLYATDYNYIDFYPDIDPVKNFANEFIIKMNKLNINFINLRNKKVFNNSNEILKSLQSGIIQLAFVPAYSVNNNLNYPLSDIYFLKKRSLSDDLMIPFREKLMEYGVFLLDIYPLGVYSIYSKNKINNDKTVLGAFIITKNLNKRFSNIVIIDDSANVKNLIKKDILNAILTPDFFLYTNDLIEAGLSYKYKINNVNSYLMIIANGSFWKNLNYNQKSIIWSFIIDYKKKYIKNFLKFKIYIENLISQKLLILNFRNIIH